MRESPGDEADRAARRTPAPTSPTTTPTSRRSTEHGVSLARSPLEPGGLRLRRRSSPPTRRSTTTRLVDEADARRRPPQRDRAERDRRARRSGSCDRCRRRPGRPRRLGTNLVRNFDELAELAWLCDPARGTARRVRRALSAARASTDDFDEMLADDALDAVVVATPVPTHYALAQAGARGRQARLRREAAGDAGARDGGARRARARSATSC